ncbi:hypothetical protein XENTR_v10015784 [Xenopus tropicalis]|nr:hypothetical protein XENTR_v10015784 [Xenopus tropicalis]
MTDHCCCGPPAHGKNCNCYMKCPTLVKDFVSGGGVGGGPGAGEMTIDAQIQKLRDLIKKLKNNIEKSREQAQPINDTQLRELDNLKKELKNIAAKSQKQAQAINDAQLRELDNLKKELENIAAKSQEQAQAINVSESHSRDLHEAMGMRM